MRFLLPAASHHCIVSLASLLVLAFLLTPGALAQTVSSAEPDGGLSITLGGTLHTDARFFPRDDEDVATSYFLIRRARVEVEVRVDDRFRFVVEPDFGEGDAALADGWIEVALGHGLSARAGRFKTPFGLESLRSSSAIWFAERAFPSALAPSRDIGLMLQGSWHDARLEAAAGVFNGVADGRSENGERSDAKDVAARVFARPFSGALDGLGLGIAVNAGSEHGSADAPALARYGTSGDRTFFAFRDGIVADGTRLRVGPQGHLYAGAFGLLAEYTCTRHRLRAPGGDTPLLTNEAWQVAAAWTLTGEPQGYGMLVPRHPVNTGGIGAVELAVRLHALRLDEASWEYAASDAATREAVAWAVALSWYPTVHTRLGLTVEQTELSRGNLPTRPPSEMLVALRAQIKF